MSTGSIPAEQDPFVNHNHDSVVGNENRALEARDGESASPDAQLLDTPPQISDQRRTQSQPILEQDKPDTSIQTPDSVQVEQSSSRKFDVPTGSQSPKTPTRRRASTTPRKPLSPAQVDAKITEVLQRQLTDKQLSRSMSGQDVGNNYLFEVVLRQQPSVIDANPTDTSEPQPQGSTRSSAPPPPPPQNQEKRVVKIGVTRGPERVRLRQIQNTCGHALVEQQDDPEHEPIALYFKAEKLIHAELRNFAHGFDCRRCDRWHGEYFDVDAAAAREVVQRWRRFCQLRPYGSDGCLRPFWACRLRGWRKRWGGRGGVDDDDDDDDGNDDDDDRGDDGDEEEEREKKWRRLRRRMRHWDRFANPTRLEFLWYDLTAPLDGLWRWRWHAIALLEGFAVAVLAFPSFPALLWFGVVVLLIFAETIRLEAPVTISAVWKTVEDFVNKLLS